jgi:2-C-methyl-D-erythritol 4-phosphate cytidylyltransferase
VAGGAGLRMKSAIPKQFLCLAGTPILMRSINVFRDFDKEINVVVVLPINQITAWKKLCEEYNFKEEILIAEGGDTRFHSVKNGLSLIQDDDGLIAVHDAVRPLISKEIIERIFHRAKRNKTAVPCIHPNDSIRLCVNSAIEPFDRNHVYLVQTPQCFQCKLLKKAYEQEYDEKFTDDATVVESLGKKIFLVNGSRENFKITTPQDIVLAEALLKSKNNIK